MSVRNDTTPRMNLVQWAKAQQPPRVTRHDVSSHVHGGLRGLALAPRSEARRYDQRHEELLRAAEATERDYAAAIARGEVLLPPDLSEVEKLQRTAEGTGRAAEAAQRLLAKKGLK